MTDFEYGRWYRDGDNKVWRMESCIETIGDYRIFAVSSFESWYSKNSPRNIAVINNDDPNIATIHIQDGNVTINADEPVPDNIMADALILTMVNDIKKSVNRWLKGGNDK